MKKKMFRVGAMILVCGLLCMSAMAPTAMAAEVQPRYDNVGTASGSISYAGQKFTVTITGIKDVTQIKVTATLYEEGFFGSSEVAKLSTSSSSSSCYGEKPCTIRKGKSYHLEISASAYLNGSWEPISNTITASF